jgi:serpin B
MNKTLRPNIDIFNLMQKGTESFVYSPFSILLAFSLLYEASVGKAREELENLFEFHNFDVVGSLTKMSEYINLGKDTEMKSSNAFWLTTKAFELKEKYAAFIEENCDKVVLGETDLGKVVRDVNSWVDEATKGHIKSIIDECLDASTRFIILNAIYFKGEWPTKFKPYHARLAFTDIEGKVSEIDTVATNPYIQDAEYIREPEKFGGIQIVSIPYKDYSARFTIFLPSKGYNSDDVHNAMKAYFKGELDYQKNEVFLKLIMPEFKIETKIESKDMEGMLKTLGVKEIYEPTGFCLKNMYEEEPLFVSKVLHKATIDVDREGTVATAATAIIGCSGCASPHTEKEYVVMALNRPFAFAVTDNSRTMPIMLGRKTKV